MTRKEYQIYLSSDLWKKTIRPQVIKRDGWRCIICGRKAECVHHKDYSEDTILGKNEEYIPQPAYDKSSIPLMTRQKWTPGKCGLQPLKTFLN